MLDAKKRPQDLHEMVQEIERSAPTAPRAEFQKRLRQQLLLKHKETSRSENQEQTEKQQMYKEKRTIGFRLTGWSYAFAMLLLVVLGVSISYPLIPAPQVEGYTLKEAVRQSSYNAPIKVVFTQPMDTSSVEKAFRIEPQIPGRFEWSQNSLQFYPDKPFEVGQNFAVTIDKSAKSLIQKSLTEDYIENFEITVAPKVLLISPNADSENIPVDNKITVLFDRPMTSLTTLEQGSAQAPDIKIEPSVSGRFKWLGTNTIAFIPDHLKYATKYTVTIPKGTKSADGGTTEEDFVTSFSTPKPVLLQTYPYDADKFQGPQAKVQLNFNQPMNLEEVKNFVHLYTFKNGQYPEFDRGGMAAVEGFVPDQWQEVNFDARYINESELKLDESGIIQPAVLSYTFEPPPKDPNLDLAEQLRNSVLLSPTNSLPFDSTFLVKIDQGFPGAEGTFTTEQKYATIFKTVGPLQVVSTAPTDGTDFEKTEGGKGNPNVLSVHFNSPIDLESLKGKVLINPSDIDEDTKKQVEPTLNAYQDELTIQYDFKPSTDYTVTIQAGVKDTFNQVLAKDFSFRFKTAPLKPNFSLITRSDISILDANKPRVYYIKSANVDSLHLNFKKLSSEEFNSIYSLGYINRQAMESISGPFTSWEKKIDHTFNEEIHTKLDLEKETQSSLEPGIYYFDVSSPGIVDNWNNQPVVNRQVFVVTGTGLATKRSQGELLIWATSLKDGAPRGGVTISAKDKNGKEVGQGSTDKNGLLTLTLPVSDNPEDYYSNEYAVTGQVDGDFTLTHSSWAEGIAPWNFNIDYDAFQSRYYVYSYTDRPIYRPGDTVYFKGLLRKDVDASFQLPDMKKVHVTVNDSRGEKVYEKILDINSNGTYNGELTLGAQARTGTYSVESKLEGTTQPDYLNTFNTYFRIAEYRKPDYELNIEKDKENYVNGDKALLKVKGSYFFGAPMPGARVEWTVRSQDYFFFLSPEKESPYASQWFSFSDEGYLCWYGCEGQNAVVSSGKATFDKNGEYTLELPLNISDKKMSQLYTVELTAFDLNNQSVSNRVMLPVHAGEYYLGILNEDYVVGKGDPVDFEVISVDYDGKPVPNKSVEVGFYKRVWNTVKKKNVDSDFYYENNYEDQLLEKKTVVTDEKGHGMVSFTTKEGGNFKAIAESKDGKGNTVKASTTVYVSSGEFINWGRENNDQIELVPDKQEYKPGDTAHILVKSPYQNVWALVTQERQNVLHKEVIKIESNSQTIDVPITEKFLPNVFVSVLLVKGGSNGAGLAEPPTGGNDERDVAAFKMGYTTLHVDTSSRRLNIEVTPDWPKYGPGDEVTLKIKTSDVTGKATKAEVSIGVVDKSVLSLTETVTADLLNAFYRKRLLGVETAHTLTKAISRVNVQVEAGLKGGGGATPEKRGIFKDTAHWEAVVNTNENGEGEVTFKLPDNLTTWEVLAIGITDDTLVGSKKAEFLVTKDVLIRPVLPRFIIVNDAMKVGAIVHNYMDRGMDFKVTLESGADVPSGFEISGDKLVTIHLEPGEEKKVEWMIKVLNEKEAVFNFSVQEVSDPAIGDLLEQRLPIHPYSFPEVVATSSTINDEVKHVETVWLPTGVDPHFGELKVTISPTLSSTIMDGLEYLVTFPYGCVEQTASSLLPNLVVKQALQLPTLQNTLIDEKQLQKNVEAGLQALYKYQQDNGGWGIWQTSETTPYLTSYVLYTLHEAKKGGYAVDDAVINRGRDFLKNYINGHPLEQYAKNVPTMTPYALNNKKYEANVRAYALYVLAEMDFGDEALTNNLYESRDNLNLFAKAQLVMTYDLLSKRQGIDEAVKKDMLNKMDTLKKDILNHAQESPRGIHFEEEERDYRLFDTNGRTTALILQMLSRIEPQHPYIPKILRHLLMEKKDGRYLSTQETSITLIALIEYLKSSKELEPTFNAHVELNGAEKLDKMYSQKNIGDVDSVTVALTDLLQNNQDNEVVANKAGQGNMYFDMNLKYYVPTEKIEPRDEGIVVNHDYYSLDDKKEEHPLENVTLGENVKGVITVIVPEDRYYVMVEDFLPAGLEGVDFSLKTSQQDLLNQARSLEDGTPMGKGCYECYGISWFNYSEVRDDRMMYFADFLPKGVYEIEYFARATTPGTFHDLPALAQELYFPEVFGRSTGHIFEVKE